MMKTWEEKWNHRAHRGKLCVLKKEIYSLWFSFDNTQH